MWLDEAPACLRIVGVLGGVWKFSALRRDEMAVYLPLAQVPTAVPGALFIRPRGDARSVLAQVRPIVQAAAADLPAARGVLLRDLVDPEFKPWRLAATVFSAFALVASLITSSGLYGVVAVSTTSRLKEIGIRMAMGARQWQVIRVVVGEGIMSVGSGLLAGSVLVVISSPALANVVFGTPPRDLTLLVQAVSILLMTSVSALAVPTLRALSSNLARVLRLE